MTSGLGSSDLSVFVVTNINTLYDINIHLLIFQLIAWCVNIYFWINIHNELTITLRLKKEVLYYRVANLQRSKLREDSKIPLDRDAIPISGKNLNRVLKKT